MKTDVILFHGDFDGIASAAVAIYLLDLKPGGYIAIACEPFNVNKTLRYFETLKNDGVSFKDLISVDIAPNNKCLSMSEKFFEKCGREFKKIIVYDHHNGWENISLPVSVIRNINPSFKSCASLIYNDCDKKNDFFTLLALDADVIDSGGYERISPGSALIYKALKSNLKDDNIKTASLRFILSQFKDAGLHDYISNLAKEYETILKRSYELAAGGIVELSKNICFIRADNNKYDITAIIMKCYEKYPLVMVEYFTGGGTFLVIATNLPGLDLPEALGLKCGAKYRVTIPGRDTAKLSEMLEKYIIKIKNL